MEPDYQTPRDSKKKGFDNIMNEPVKLIFTGKMARALLRKGFQIVDVKPNKDFRERTVFVFKDVPGLKDEVRKLSEK